MTNTERTLTKPSLVVIVGATTTGKTKLAASLARVLGGELVNADKFYLFDGFAVGTGRADIVAHGDIPNHLFPRINHDHTALVWLCLTWGCSYE